MSKLSIIIVNWNVIQLLSNCLDSIKKNLADIDYEVIVVDNASTDGSAQILKEKYPWITLIENKNNEGFARANNQGFEIARGEYILILNPDTLIKGGSIQKMINVLNTNSYIGIVGPRIVDEYGSITPACKRKSLNLKHILIRRFQIEKVAMFLINRIEYLRRNYYRSFYKSSTVSCLQGACMLVRKKHLDTVGYFDENVPMYLDDIDLCYRFKKSNFELYYCAESEIIHFCGASTKKSTKPKSLDLMVYKAVDVFFTKHKNILYVFIHRMILFFSNLMLISFDIISLPITIIICKDYILSLINKHFNALVYSLTGQLIIHDFRNYTKSK